MGSAQTVGAPSSLPVQYATSASASASSSSSASTNSGSSKTVLTLQQLVDYVLPIYYTKEPLTKDEKEKLFSTWKLIRLNKAAGFYRLKKEDPEFTPCGSPMEFFANRFTIRLIEVHPVCQSMFTKTTLKQGSMVMNMISSLLGCLEEEEAREKEAGDGADGEEKEIGGGGVGGGRKGTGNAKFVKQLEMLATSHTRLGVRASEFGIFGEVLFWALRITLGSEDYDFTAHTAWIKFYSRMLEVIVPMVLKYETEHRESFSRFNAKRMMPVMQVKNMIAEGLKE